MISKYRGHSTPCKLIRRTKSPDLSLFRITQLDIKRAPVLLQVRHPLRAWNRKNILSLLQQPREPELRNGTALLISQRLELRYNIDILLPVIALETRQPERPDVVPLGARVVASAEGGREDAADQGRGDDDGDAELTAGCEEVGAGGALDLVVEDGVFRLDGGDRGDFAGAAEGG